MDYTLLGITFLFIGIFLLSLTHSLTHWFILFVVRFEKHFVLKELLMVHVQHQSMVIPLTQLKIGVQQMDILLVYQLELMHFIKLYNFVSKFVVYSFLSFLLLFNHFFRNLLLAQSIMGIFNILQIALSMYICTNILTSAVITQSMNDSINYLLMLPIVACIGLGVYTLWMRFSLQLLSSFSPF